MGCPSCYTSHSSLSSSPPSDFLSLISSVHLRRSYQPLRLRRSLTCSAISSPSLGAVLKMARLVKDVSLKAQKVGDWKDEFGFMLADILKQNKVNNSGMRFEPAVRTADFDRFIAEYESDRTSYCWSTMINFRANEEIEKEALYRVQAQKNSEKSKEFKLFTLLWGVLQNNVIDALC
uniref:Uncharacterized protein n=1 Tax=Chenopodium quinoa TaxID=63459 RepID=A0A803LMC0_CHEQI